MTQTFLPLLLLAKGTIINIGSVAGHLPLPFMSIYCASKAALFAYSESLRIELAPLNVAVTYINTGHIKTNNNHISTHYHLDKSSLWYPINDTFQREQKNAGGAGMDVSVFAKDLATRVLESRRDTMWIGESAWGCWLASTLEGWLPFGWRFMPIALWKMYGMERVAVHAK
jgi:1-acylglycerone phosphate reductase